MCACVCECLCTLGGVVKRRRVISASGLQRKKEVAENVTILFYHIIFSLQNAKHGHNSHCFVTLPKQMLHRLHDTIHTWSKDVPSPADINNSRAATLSGQSLETGAFHDTSTMPYTRPILILPKTCRQGSHVPWSRWWHFQTSRVNGLWDIASGISGNFGGVTQLGGL